MASTKVKLDKELVERAEKHAAEAGYSSVEEFISHLVERELARAESGEDEEAVKEKLQGLGYIS